MFKKYIILIFRITIFINVGFAIVYFLNRPVGGGDELFFINDLKYVFNEGIFEALEKGVSIPHLILVLPFGLFLDYYIALRIVSILLFIFLLWYFYYLRKVKHINFYFLLFFFFSATGHHLLGTNDMLFFAALTIFSSEVYFISKSTKKENGIILWLALIIVVFTRALIVVYIPALLLGLYLLWNHRKKVSNNIFIPLGLLILLIGLNIPSLWENKRLSYDNKQPPATVTASWTQRQYYAQLLVNDEKLRNYDHPSWEETDDYIKKHGANALPYGSIEALTKDPLLTLKEFFKDLWDSIYFGLRQTGFVLLFVIYFGILYFLKEKAITSNNFIPLIVIISLSVISFITISFIESRWLAPVFILAILFYSNLETKEKIPESLILINYIFIALTAIYGCFVMLSKLI